MMTRNTEHRVEIAYPVLDPTCRAMVRDYMADQLRDNVKARELSAQSTWEPVARAEGDEPFNAQEHFMTQAANRARAAEERRAARAVEVERAARDEIAHDAETVNPRAGRAPDTSNADATPSQPVASTTETNELNQAVEPQETDGHKGTEQGKESNFKRGWHMVMRGFREMLS